MRGTQKFLYISLFILVAGILSLAWSMYSHGQREAESEQLKQDIAAQLNQDTEISSEEKQQIEDVIRSYSRASNILHLAIYYSENGLRDSSDLTVEDAKYVYLDREPKSLVDHTMHGAPLQDGWFIEMQVKEDGAGAQYQIPFVLFLIFGVLILGWVIVQTVQQKNKLKLMQKLAAAVISSLLLSLLVSYLNYVPVDERLPNVYYSPFWPSVPFYSLYIFPIYLIGGIFSSIAIDSIFKEIPLHSKFVQYLVKIGVYALAGMIVAFLFLKIFGGSMLENSLMLYMGLGMVASILYYHVTLIFRRNEE